MRTVAALIDRDGQVRLLEPVHPGATCRALVVIFDDDEDVRADRSSQSHAVCLERGCLWSLLRDATPA